MVVIEQLSKKQVILQAAADLFKEKGYNASSIRDLAAKVGLEPSSIYSHIKSKEDLLSEICMSCAHKFTEGILHIIGQEKSAKKRLKALISLHLHIAYDNPASSTVFNDEWRYLNEPIKTEFLALRKEYEKKFKKILLDGKEDGKLHFDDIDIVFNIIIKALSWSYDGVKKHKREVVEVSLTEFILKALA